MAKLIAKYEPHPRDWYENPPVVYGFNFPKVRAKLEWLMGSHVVQALDRGYHHMLMKMMAEDYQETIMHDIRTRERAEINREKQLVLEGKMSVEQAPKGISKNPVLRINAYIQEVAKEKEKLRKVCARVEHPYDYRVIKAFIKSRGVKKTGYGETVYDITCCYKLPIIRRTMDDIGAEGEEGEEERAKYRLPPEEYARARRTDPVIDDLISAKNVEELYRVSDFILGYARVPSKEVHVSDEESTVI